MSDKMYSAAVKHKTVQVAQLMLQRVGCEVTEIRDGNRYTLDVVVPADPADPHGERLKAALAGVSPKLD